MTSSHSKGRRKLKNLAAGTKGTAIGEKLEELEKVAETHMKDKQAYLDKVRKMERYIASAQNLIAQNLGESVRALLEMAGDKLNLASLKRVQHSGREIQTHQQAATMALEVLKRDFGKLVVLVAAGPGPESWRDLPSRCKDVSSAAEMYAISLETLHGKTKTHGALISEEIERVSKVKRSPAVDGGGGGGRGGGGRGGGGGGRGGGRGKAGAGAGAAAKRKKIRCLKRKKVSTYTIRL